MTTSLHSEAWASFFSSTAEISGGLLGLIFVALSVTPRMRAVDGDAVMNGLASQVFGDFLSVLPRLAHPAHPCPLGGSHRRLPRSGRRLRNGAPPGGWLPTWRSKLRSHGAQLVRRLVMSLCGNAAIVVAGAVAWLARERVDQDLFWRFVVSGVLVLMLSGSRTAWILLTHAPVA